MRAILASDPYAARSAWQRDFWREWVIANALAEFVGLGLSAALTAFAVTRSTAAGPAAVAVIVVVGSTLVEGTAVGTAQWWVLRTVLQRITWRAWLLATALGALIAWTLGMLPSTLMALGEEAAAEPMPEPSNLVVYALALLMGLVLGPILGTPQWWVLRRHLSSPTWWWIPANAAAWAVGMLVIFVGISLAPMQGITLALLLIIGLTLLVAGAAVGAIHGAVLVWMLARSGESPHQMYNMSVSGESNGSTTGEDTWPKSSPTARSITRRSPN